jgi:hypothetical protein
MGDRPQFSSMVLGDAIRFDELGIIFCYVVNATAKVLN